MRGWPRRRRNLGASAGRSQRDKAGRQRDTRRSHSAHQPPTAFIRRILCACSRRVGDGDVEALDLMLGLAEGIDTAIAEARHGPAHLRLSWAEIGSRLGVTRQAAQQR